MKQNKTGTICGKCNGWIQVAYYRGDEPKMCNCSNYAPLPSDFVEIKEIGWANGMDFHINETLINGIKMSSYCGCSWCND